MRLRLSSFSVMIIGLLLLGGASQVQDFRETAWGMSPSQVKHAENLRLESQDRETMTYKGALAGLESEVVYHFADDRLVEGQYVITHKHWEREGYIEAYANLKNLLTQKYGEPVIDETKWTNHQYEHTESQWGLAVAMGQLTYQCVWETERTVISMKLWGSDDIEINHEITYRERGVEIPVKGDKQTLRQL